MHCDIAIVGGNHSGLALALSLAHLSGGAARIVVVERGARQRDAATGDPRAFAISAASRRLLTRIGAWDRLAASAQEVFEIDITDSSLGDAKRPVLLHYANQIPGGEPATHIVPADAIRAALLGALEAAGDVDLRFGTAVASWDVQADGVDLRLDDGSAIRARLLVAADGGRSAVREAAGIKVLTWGMGQVGIVATIAHELPHNGQAVQHFLPAGPFAILPLRGNRSCITWSEEAERGARIVAADDATFLAEVERRFGHKLGAIRLEGRRGMWPLQMRMARALTGVRLALIGDAARTVHPLAGQGLNLALRDVAALAECVVDAMRLGLEPSDTAALERYARWRRFDATTSAASYAALNVLFSNDSLALRALRDVGLGVVDRLPGLKQLFVEEAAGVTGELPSLMRVA
ncbi:MAG: FAD-dependent monooxygenase [Hyphomicrobiaceae bacterium]